MEILQESHSRPKELWVQLPNFEGPILIPPAPLFPSLVLHPKIVDIVDPDLNNTLLVHPSSTFLLGIGAAFLSGNLNLTDLGAQNLLELEIFTLFLMGDMHKPFSISGCQ